MNRGRILWIFIPAVLLLGFLLSCLLQGPATGGGIESSGFWASDKVSRIPLSILRGCLDRKGARELTSPFFEFTCDGKVFEASTSLDHDLQSYLDSLMGQAIGQLTAIVCIDPVSGRILAMSGFDRDVPDAKVWVRRLVPSASIFKIVTAAGAIEFLGMTPQTPFWYNGGKHTLYRYQLRDKKNRYTVKATLKEAFQDSINPIFGKLGSIYLGCKGIVEMADRFLWQREIPLEIPVARSTLTILDDSFNIAEVASGFNKATKITALHGALIVAAIANGGVMMAPSFIDTIKDSGGDTIYQSRIYPLTRPVNPKTADLLFEMMKATVKKGTARKAFLHSHGDKVLGKLEIGGKTGTIDNESHDLRFDWFCGIAKEREGGRTMAVAVVVAHKDVLGTRAASYARQAIKRYFRKEGH